MCMWGVPQVETRIRTFEMHFVRQVQWADYYTREVARLKGRPARVGRRGSVLCLSVCDRGQRRVVGNFFFQKQCSTR